MIRRLLPIGIWAVLLGLALLLLAQRLETSSDLTAFLPQDASDQTSLLARHLEHDIQSQWLLVALRGGTAVERERLRLELGQRLRESGLFQTVIDGRMAAATSRMDPERYLLTGHALDVASLRRAMHDIQAMLYTPLAGDLTRLRRDPTGAQIVLSTGPAGLLTTNAPEAGMSLIALQAHALTEPREARHILATVADQLASIRAQGIDGQMTGPAVFAAESERHIRGEIDHLMILAGLGVLLILSLAYRPALPAWLSILPPLTGLLGGMALVVLVFGQLHGIAIAFSAILIGISVDYAIHQLSHRHPERIRQTLLLSALTSIAALGSWLLSGIPGLMQTGLLTASGLLLAALTSLYVLPVLPFAAATAPRGAVPLIPLATPGSARRISLLVLGLSLLLIIASPGKVFDDRPPLAGVVSPERLALDRELRLAADMPDAGYSLWVTADDRETLLQRLERLEPLLRQAQNEGWIGNHLSAAQYLPSLARQLARQALLPDHEELSRRLVIATQGTALRPEAFTAFIEDVQQARTTRPVDPAALPALAPARAAMLEHLLYEDPVSGQWHAPVLLRQVDTDHLADLAERFATSPAQWLNLPAQIEAAMAETRRQAIWLSAGFLLFILLLITPSHPRGVIGSLSQVTLPLLAALLGTVALLRLFGIGINLFHVVALVLVAGLAADYRLFLYRHDAPEQRPATHHALLAAMASSFCVFALLAGASTPILRDLGITILTGVFLALLPEWLTGLTSLTRRHGRPGHRPPF
ncbi:MAG: hypothetical protein LPK58_07070 [Gammaproteobacteria bacterium]|nr:hypothetical protein [Gammaproteobacteria bacterium]MDX5503023.1 hypothetical protein [Halomonas sp.]